MAKYVHILRPPPHEWKRVEARIAQCSKGEKRRLQRYVCGGCEQQLHRAGCGAYGGCEPCSEDQRLARIEGCLAGYRPRKAAKATGGENAG